MQFYKPYLPLSEWADHFKYVANVEGNCGSARLAYQLFSDAAVMLVIGDDEEWSVFTHFQCVAPPGS